MARSSLEIKKSIISKWINMNLLEMNRVICAYKWYKFIPAISEDDTFSTIAAYLCSRI